MADLFENLAWFAAGFAVGSASKNAARLVWMQLKRPEQG